MGCCAPKSRRRTDSRQGNTPSGVAPQISEHERGQREPHQAPLRSSAQFAHQPQHGPSTATRPRDERPFAHTDVLAAQAPRTRVASRRVLTVCRCDGTSTRTACGACGEPHGAAATCSRRGRPGSADHPIEKTVACCAGLRPRPAQTAEPRQALPAIRRGSRTRVADFPTRAVLSGAPRACGTPLAD